LPAFSTLPAGANIQKSPSNFVMGHLQDFIDDKLTPEQSTHLVLIANQAATASACDGFELDEGKFKAAFDKLAHVSEEYMSAEKKDYFEKHLMLVYGIAICGFLADTAADTGAFCAAAEEEHTDPDFQEVSVFK
jgi:hypothetical protein